MSNRQLAGTVFIIIKNYLKLPKTEFSFFFASIFWLSPAEKIYKLALARTTDPNRPTKKGRDPYNRWISVIMNT